MPTYSKGIHVVKINSVVDTIERGGDVGEETPFTIEFNAKMARMLSKGIYQNVIRAPIRELSCNAIDSHRAAGKLDTPIRVHLPNNLEPYFEVQDFGLGLSHEKVMTFYNRYGASDKDTSNLDIGGFGIGGKAPFAYTTSFTVTSVWNGVRRHYAMYQNAAGKPSVSVMGQEDTTDCNGVTVRMPVKSSDFEAFRENAQETFRWFEHQPLVIGNSRYALPKAEYVPGFDSGTWRLLSSAKDRGYYYRSQVAMAVMANVAYPIRADNVRDNLRHLLGYPLVIDFANGELEPAVSREELNYDPLTVQVLETRIEGIMRDFGRMIEDRIKNCNTAWEAKVALVEISQDSSTNYILRTLVQGGFTPRWRGQLVDSETYAYWSNSKLFDKLSPAPVVQCVSETYRARSSSEIVVNRNTVIVLKDCADAGARCRKAYYDSSSRKGRAYLVEGVSQDPANKDAVIWNATKCGQVAKWLAWLGNPPTVLASSLPKPDKKVMTFKGAAWTGRGGNYHRAPKSANWNTEKDLTTDQGGFYVTIDGLTPWKKDVGELDLGTILNGAVTLNILPKGTQVWGINKTNSKLISGNPAWKEIHGFVSAALSTMIQAHQIGTLMQEKAQLNAANSRCYGTAKEWLLRFGKCNNLLRRYTHEWQRICQAQVNNLDVDTMRTLARAVHVKIDETVAQKAVDLESMWNQVITTYPLMRHATRIHPTHHTFAEFIDYVNLIDASGN